jgi:beta-lactamase class A
MRACVSSIEPTVNVTILREVGGPPELTRYARALGDERFRLDRWETELNTAAPGDARDTTTPMAMARTLQKLLLLDGLPTEPQARLRVWMLGNTTGNTRIRAAVPAIYTRQFIEDADARNDIVFQATRIALRSIRDIS